MLLGYIVCREGVAVDPDKVKTILEAPALTNAKALNRFLGQIRWHCRMIRYLTNVVVHKTPFQWTNAEQDAYGCLQKMLTKGASCTTAGVAEAFSCVCRRIRCSNQKVINVADGAKLG